MDEIVDHVTRGSFMVAAQMQYFRKLRGMSQEQLAKATGMKQSTISRLENTPDTQWTTTTLLKIAAALDMAVECKLGADSKL